LGGFEGRRIEANKKAENVLACLRLLGFSRVYFQEIFHRRTTWVFPDIRPYPVRFLPDYVYTDPKKVSQEQLVDLWKMLAKPIANGKINIVFAIKRFSYSHERYD
jgi:hypothetical protein